ncbi:hypothetical protein ANO11243_019890 [Dothideomycetidae sp. 11243]|nr:hypothetical protein ANO11243_019890 [fungal sp. No.11243]
MKTDFKFSNLLGTVYRHGNLCFSPDGTALLSPVGNRVTHFDLVNNKSYTLPFSHRKNISRLALHPQGHLLLTIDDDGQSILTHLHRRVVLYHFSLKGAVSALSFSPSGEHFAVSIGRKIETWRTPSAPGDNGDGGLDFAPFVKHRDYVGHHDTVQCIEWSSDSRFFLSSSKDLTARVWSLDPEEGFTATTLAGHRQAVHSAWFSADQEIIYTVSKDGALFSWKYVAPITSEEHEEDIPEEKFRWRIIDRHYFNQTPAVLTCASYHPSTNLLVAGFSNGTFGLYELPGFNQIHNLSISQNNIDYVTINKTGEWLAFGASAFGQLLVWEWQSESYILKQQGHFDAINALTYSPSGDRIITCSEDGKVKVWDALSGFCVVTFTEHTSSVTACEYAKRGNVLFTASLDGSVRAWDLIRYRNFRTFTAPTRLSFSCVAVDPSGEVVAAGSQDSFDIHLWSVQTGQLLDRMSGHEGPVSSLAFTPDGGSLVSGSWDHTVRIWSVFARTQSSEPLQLQADVVKIAVRPDSKQVAVSTLDGQLTFWSISEGSQQSGLDGRRDVSGGRKISDRRTAANVAGTKSFSSLCYSADGAVVVASGNSKYICLYDVESGVLLHKYTVSVNLSLNGTQEYLNTKNLTEAGPRGLLNDQGEGSDLEDRLDHSLPGAKRGDAAQRRQAAEVKVPDVAFAPTGRAFCAASTEGLLIYSLDASVAFDPFDLDVTVTPASTMRMIEEGDYLRGIVMAFRLNNMKLVTRAYRAVPPDDITLLVNDLPLVYVNRLLRHISEQADQSPYLELNLRWLEAIIKSHGTHLKQKQGEFGEVVRMMQRIVNRIQKDIMGMVSSNEHTIDFLLSQADGRGTVAGGGEVKPLQNGNGIHKEDQNMSDGDGEWIGLE